MKIHLIDNTEIDVVGASEPKLFEGMHLNGLKTSYAAEIIYKFYELVTGTEFNGDQANWLILGNERVRIWKCRLRSPISKVNLYRYECVTDSEHPI